MKLSLQLNQSWNYLSSWSWLSWLWSRVRLVSLMQHARQIGIEPTVSVSQLNVKLATVSIIFSRTSIALVGRPNGMFVSQQVTLSCPPNLSTQSGVIQVSWLLTNDTVDMLELNPGSDPSLEQDGYSLTVTNVTSEYEGIYYCKVTYAASNQPEVTAAAGCLYVAGTLCLWLWPCIVLASL